jgi:hypothetical protein
VISWLILTLLSVPVVVAPFVLPGEAISRWAPVCERKAKSGQECLLCGMTTAFLLIGEGECQEASHHNRASLPLFFVLLGNQLLAVWFVWRFRISYN